jgi:glutamine synthetase
MLDLPSRLEYIWIDADGEVRSKTKVLRLNMVPRAPYLEIPEWGFDGSSTGQADGHASDVVLRPAFVVKDPFRGMEDYLVLCETFNPDGTPHETNHRRRLVEIMNRHKELQPLMGIEQEYVMMAAGRPLGWPKEEEPGEQGPYYCGAGYSKVAGRVLAEDHLNKCLWAELPVTGINAEVMLGQWEYQIGTSDPLHVSDALWVSRWIMQRLAEDYGIDISYHPKPIDGDWNGSGAHTNFSTLAMRTPTKSEVYRQVIEDATERDTNKVELEVPVTGMEAINQACELIGQRVEAHLAVYGEHNEKRLTGKHETCSIKEFKYGVSDRGASIRIPLHVSQKGHGYFEDRRPASNIDPYQVSAVMLETITGDH